VATPIPSTLYHDYLIRDITRMYVRMADNEGWFRQTWLGVPIWQLPEDLIRLQRAVFDVKPQWIVETGTKFGGSAIFFASILKMLGRSPADPGGVVTIDIEQTEAAKAALTTHDLASFVKASFVGDAAAPETFAKVGDVISKAPGTTLVFLDDNHNADHVYREMTGYSPLVTRGSYLVVADTVYADLVGTPVGKPTEKYPDVLNSNPRVAVDRFLATNSDYARDMTFADGGAGNFLDGFLRRS
jgi:cephalosporin hydroxylase